MHVLNSISIRVRTDLGTDTRPHPLLCRSTRCRSILTDRHWSNCTGNKCQQQVSFYTGPSLSLCVVALCAAFDQYLEVSMPAHHCRTRFPEREFISQILMVVLPDKAFANYQLITTTCCRKRPILLSFMTT